MANVAALLAQYQAVKAQISYYTLEQIKWQGLHDTMSEKVSKFANYEEDYNGASQDYCDKYDENGKFEKKGTRWLWTSTSNSTQEWKNKDGEVTSSSVHTSWKAEYFNGNKQVKKAGAGSSFPGWDEFITDRDLIASLYAGKVCSQFANGGSDKLEEYTNLDMEYDAMLTTMETMLTSLRAQEESLKTAVGEGAKDTGMSTGG